MSETTEKVQLPGHLTEALNESNLRLRSKMMPLVPETLHTVAHDVMEAHYQEVAGIIAAEVRLRHAHATQVQRSLIELTRELEDISNTAEIVRARLDSLGEDEMPPLPRTSKKTPLKKKKPVKVRGVSVAEAEEEEY